MESLKYIEILNNIKILGFENYGFLKDSNVCYLLKNTENKILKLSIHPFETTKENDEIVSIHFNINFIAVTKILNEALELEYRPEFPYWEENADTIMIDDDLFTKINHEPNRVLLKHTMTQQDIVEFYNQIQLIYTEFLLPFAESYPDIKTINREIIEKKNSDEWHSMIPGETIFKSLIIMKLSENRNYDNFLNEYKSNIENAINNGNSRYISYYNKLTKLIEYLNSSDYKQFL